MSGILGNAQTYIGVLATLVVLCLFNKKNNNFLYTVILKVGDDMKSFLTNYVAKLKDSIASIFNDENEDWKKFISKIGEKTGDNEQKLLKEYRELDLLPYEFHKEATMIKDGFKPVFFLKKKEEPTLIALFTLLMIIFVMFVDALECVGLAYRVLFVNILLATSTIYSYVLYRNFLTEKNNQINEEPEKQHWKGLIMPVLTVVVFFIWLGFIYFINNKYIAGVLLYILLFDGFLKINKIKKSDGDNNSLNRIFVLKHSLYIVLYSLGCSFVSMAIFNNYPIDNDWRNNVTILFDSGIAQYLSICIFTLNALLLPLFSGCYLLWKQEQIVLDKINDIRNKYEKKVKDKENDFRSLKAEYEKKQTFTQERTTLEYL